ncbi:F-box/kelch-repeat protein At3g23880-like [Nicotiana tomentosiformis]|uniref:F-box/kelch-repeat protein At3g23880-like n=1 Tax=Nicotiana tomentosiformis TaxID=4098 RepID=UPI00051AC422|nr:F-box/kelch-repeat protein At3g23880-like [Nicotiana tomentosiformis]XP_018631564.1 F-box/kelch-repeat protein At3g23880-like [Nicotiana tomentosiformis]
MESQRVEAVPRHPKESKLQNPAHVPSISRKDSIFSMPNLPAELITEILLKLPVKPLLRFSCVSKSWLALISSPEFVKTHLLLSASNKNYTHHGVIFEVSNDNHNVKDCSLSSLLYNSVTEAFDLDYPSKNPNHFPRIVGSINGLICLVISSFDGLPDLFLWNLSVRKYKKLRNYRLNVSRRYHEDECVDFNFGFAYDEFQDDYKVVGVFPIYRYVHLCRIEVKIYNLKSNSWRSIDDFKGRLLLDDHSGKLVNGKLYWLDRGWNIVSIDLTDEKWAEVEQPCSFKKCDFLSLGVFRSDLSAFCNEAWTHVDVWVMKEYGVKESWEKIFTIKSPVDSTGNRFHPLILMSNEGEILLQFGSRFTNYNSKDDSIKYLDVTNFAPSLEAQIYVKSLVCPFLPRTQQQQRS